MPAAVAGPEIERLIQLLARLPGLGPRSARRAALHLIKKREQLMSPLADAIETAREKIVICSVIAPSADANVNVSKQSVRTSRSPPIAPRDVLWKPSRPWFMAARRRCATRFSRCVSS